MKSKVEEKLDKELEKLGLRRRVYHFTDRVTPFTAITTAIASKPTHRTPTWNEISIIVKFDIEYVTTHFRYDHASELIRRLKKHDVKGIAICDRRDQFNRQRGRIIAKGRLLKHLKKGANKDNMTETLMDGLLSEIERCSKLKVLYDEIPTGAFGALMIQQIIDNAKVAVASGDIEEMIRALKLCQGAK